MSTSSAAVRPSRIVLAAATVALLLSASLAASPPADARGPQGEQVSVIVAFDRAVTNPQAEAQQLARQHGFALGHVYRTALRGFSATLSAHAAAQLERNPRVRRVEHDSLEQIVSQTLPTGIERIGADRNPLVSTGTAVDADIAIIDTGIDPAHPDLDVAGGRNFTGGSLTNWSDGNGHGTHVAGTVAARANGIGVVGVAPGARLWSLKVCGNNGQCWSSDIVAAIDWAAQQKRSGAIDFAAANFSISSQDSSNSCASPANATHAAICGLVDEGVVFVMAAGNDNRVKVPYPVAFSVSAIADFDGRPGGEGAPTCRSDTDDTLANFSNRGTAIDIAAPGVCILSTWPGGRYHTISGTSMATPHVTGAVALYLHANGLQPASSAAGVAAIEGAVVGAALPQGTQNHACSYDDSRPGGPLLFVNAGAFGGDGRCGDEGGGDEPDPLPNPPTAGFSSSCDGLTCAFTDESAGAGAWLWEFGDGTSSAEENPTHTYAAGGTYTVTLSVANDDGDDSTSKVVQVTAPGTGEPTVVTVAGVTYATHGRWHLRVTVAVVDAGSSGVDGATVAITIIGAGGGATQSATGTTGADGTVTVQFNHALRDAACYTTTVTQVTGSGLAWDGSYPSTGNCS